MALIRGKKVVVVFPAYNAERTLERTYRDIPFDVVDGVILVDDASRDNTVEVARRLGISTVVHPENRGYGGNQKTCYREALRMGADIVVMVHPDYQYPPQLIPAMASLIEIGMFDVVLGSRIVKGAVKQGMPVFKFVINRLLTLFQNIVINQRLSEYHTGYRAFSRKILESLPIGENSDDFAFDNQILAQAFHFGNRVGEISCPARYFAESSSIGFWRGVKYAFEVVGTTLEYRLERIGLAKFRKFDPVGRRLL